MGDIRSLDYSSHRDVRGHWGYVATCSADMYISKNTYIYIRIRDMQQWIGIYRGVGDIGICAGTCRYFYLALVSCSAFETVEKSKMVKNMKRAADIWLI